MHPRCIKCNGKHAKRECSIKEKIVDPTCINCGEKGHLAAWKGCKALPLIQKSSVRQERKTYAQATADKKKNEEKTEDKTTVAADLITDLKEPINAIREVKTLIQEFPTLLEAARLCREAKTKNEKVLIVLNGLLGE
ncbi:hypothetical protein AVEN_113864-1 [Araneus ventricosus]|uniref:Pre-C2HC domain-containing protein n=1 Tax=Araneus ventricosus TaxID=182803 RepID=A0A4Y2V680_ARAVE|nr:hypothetical protein AVEN_113864-1 [Araneus ventricosus]